MCARTLVVYSVALCCYASLSIIMYLRNILIYRLALSSRTGIYVTKKKAICIRLGAVGVEEVVDSAAMVNDEHAKDNFKDAAIDFIAGSLGGVAMVLVGQPLDTVKVKMQTFPALYQGMAHCFQQTLKKEGIARGLYAGTVPSIIANVAENSVLFTGYGACQKIVANITSQRTEDLGIVANGTAGFFAAFFSSFTLCPTELIKCQLQAMREMQMRSLEPGQNVEGIPGLFRGLTSTLAREMPGYFFFFGGYEGTRELLTPPGKTKDEIGPFRTMIAGAVGGMIFWTIIFPADVVKSRIQVEGLRDSMTSVLLRIFRQEGITALYSGLQPTLVRTIPATAALFLVYETSKKMLHSLLS